MASKPLALIGKTPRQARRLGFELDIALNSDDGRPLPEKAYAMRGGGWVKLRLTNKINGARFWLCGEPDDDAVEWGAVR